MNSGCRTRAIMVKAVTATTGAQSMRTRLFDFSRFSMLQWVNGGVHGDGPHGNKQCPRDGEQYRDYLLVAKYYTNYFHYLPLTYHPLRMEKNNDVTGLLMSLGLNELEAEVYVALLTQPSLTGYKIGKLINKPAANVYKALDALARKGAVMLEEGSSQLCRAVPVQEFVNQLERDFLHKTRQAYQSLSHLRPAPADEKSYQLFSAPLVLERCRQMLQRCTTIAVIDVFPEPLEAIRPAIEEATARGVEVYLQVYRETTLPGVHLVLTSLAETAIEYWSSQQLNIVVDGREYLLALFNQDASEVYQATWSRNLYVSSMLHAGFSNEHTIHQIKALSGTEAFPERLNEILKQQKFLSNSNVPGVKELLARFTAKK